MASRSVKEIIKYRDDMLKCSLGTDIEYSEICETLAINQRKSTDELNNEWFDWCVDKISHIFKDGHAIVYRAISVDDTDEFIRNTKSGIPLGSHWTWDKKCATTILHSGIWRDNEILLIGKVSESSVCWGTTFQQHFSHPSEREIFVNGPICLQQIIRLDTEESLDWQERMLST